MQTSPSLKCKPQTPVRVLILFCSLFSSSFIFFSRRSCLFRFLFLCGRPYPLFNSFFLLDRLRGRVPRPSAEPAPSDRPKFRGVISLNSVTCYPGALQTTPPGLAQDGPENSPTAIAEVRSASETTTKLKDKENATTWTPALRGSPPFWALT